MPKETEQTFETITKAINTLLEENNSENRKKAKVCIETAAQNGRILPHLKDLHEYLQKQAKSIQKKHQLVINEIRSWIHQATPIVELSKADMQSLILELSQQEPTVELVKKMLKGVSSLNLQDNPIHEPGTKAIAEVLKDNSTLTSLNLRGSPIDGPGAKAFAEALTTNSTLTDLNLLCTGIGAQIKDIAKALESNTGLLTLNLSFNSIGNSGAKDIAEMLKINSTLTNLYLMRCGIRAEGAHDLAEALTFNSTLLSLNLSENILYARGAKSFADALKINATLTMLSLNDNEIGDTGAHDLAEALKFNTALASLSLYYNQITGPGAKDIAEVLESNTTLLSLNLGHNLIGDLGVKAFAKVLKSNTTMTSLKLGECKIQSPDAEKDIAEALENNFSLTELEVNKSFDERTQVYLQRNKDRSTEVTHYIQTNFASDLFEAGQLIPNIVDIISHYLTPADLISQSRDSTNNESSSFNSSTTTTPFPYAATLSRSNPVFSSSKSDSKKTNKRNDNYSPSCNNDSCLIL